VCGWLFCCRWWLPIQLLDVTAIKSEQQQVGLSAQIAFSRLILELAHLFLILTAAVRDWPVQYYRRAYLSGDRQQDRVRFLIRPDWWTRKRFEDGQSFDKANYIFYS
jgi:hypothetical protein